MIIKGLAGEPLPLYGDGKNIQDWLYVEDHAKPLMLALERGVVGQTYNVGGRNERTNLHVVETACDIAPATVGTRRNLISFVKDRPGRDRRYAIDASKIEWELGWQADESFESGLSKTVRWYCDNQTWGKQFLIAAISTPVSGWARTSSNQASAICLSDLSTRRDGDKLRGLPVRSLTSCEWFISNRVRRRVELPFFPSLLRALSRVVDATLPSISRNEALRRENRVGL
jgi:hypothetical protein